MTEKIDLILAGGLALFPLCYTRAKSIKRQRGKKQIPINF